MSQWLGGARRLLARTATVLRQRGESGRGRTGWRGARQADHGGYMPMRVSRLKTVTVTPEMGIYPGDGVLTAREGQEGTWQGVAPWRV